MQGGDTGSCRKERKRAGREAAGESEKEEGSKRRREGNRKDIERRELQEREKRGEEEKVKKESNGIGGTAHAGKTKRETGSEKDPRKYRGRHGGKEPTRNGGRSEPVERRGPGALPHALQPGIVCCPPTPGEPAGEGRQAEGAAPDKEGTPPMAQGTGRHRAHGGCTEQGIQQDKTKHR